MEKEEVDRRRSKEWTQMDIASSARAAEDRTRWKGVIMKSSSALTTLLGYGID